MTFTEYLKCSIANKFTLVGYSLSSTGLAAGIYSIASQSGPQSTVNDIAIYGFSSGVVLLLNTLFGAHTYIMYKRAKNYIQKHKRFEQRIISSDKSYCAQAGFNLAKRECQLEGLLKD